MAFMYASLGKVKRGKTRQEDKFQSNLGSSSHLRLDMRFNQINQIQEAKEYFSKILKQGSHIGFYSTRREWLEDKPSLVLELD